jgi:hypothetical protein
MFGFFWCPGLLDSSVSSLNTKLLGIRDSGSRIKGSTLSIPYAIKEALDLILDLVFKLTSRKSDGLSVEYVI